MSQRFSNDQLQRYSRHILLPQVGGRGQERLLGARVFVVGAGGLGSPAILYLAAAGVGTIEVADGDCVDLSNLQRQVLHGTPDVGTPKVESARQAVAAINPDVRFIGHREWLRQENILRLMADADVVVEGSDNFSTRFLVNDACRMLRKPLVSGALFRFEGQISVFPNDGGADSPCYRCLFPEPPPPGLIPTCAEAGILGSVAGVIGTLQATEVLKLLLGIGETLAGRLVVADLLAMRFREVRLHRDPDCPLCGDHPTITELVQYPDPQCPVREG